MASARTVKAGQGLSALAKQDFARRIQRETDAKFASVMVNVRGKAGTIKRAALESVKSKGNPLDFSLAVIQLHGYEVQVDGDTVRYAVPRAIVAEQPAQQAKPEPIVKANAA